ncbi:SDR family NAD(P)-dependent oxidoreductase [Kribbella sp. NPDC051620]|uniref:SDR family NAD(P)-dependent oxidoreductase n=1 Tax=Kribbella sp. NPDC051620 TaxID=3364120 RepID=UPI003793BF88
MPHSAEEPRNSGAKIALVTGAGRGSGRAIAQRLSAAGHRVVLTARTRDELEQVADSCPGETLVVPADITDQAGVEEVFSQAETAWGTVDILVANAGAGFSARLERTDDEQWLRMIDLNLTAPFRCLRRAIPAMRKEKWGRIVVVASTAARVGEPYIAAYAASKHGALGLVRVAATELASDGITVNAVCPGFVDTPMTDATIARIASGSGRTEAEARAIIEGKQPIGRLITPDEVAAAVLYCTETAAMSGQGLTIDGGSIQP